MTTSLLVTLVKIIVSIANEISMGGGGVINLVNYLMILASG